MTDNSEKKLTSMTAFPPQAAQWPSWQAMEKAEPSVSQTIVRPHRAVRPCPSPQRHGSFHQPGAGHNHISQNQLVGWVLHWEIVWAAVTASGSEPPAVVLVTSPSRLNGRAATFLQASMRKFTGMNPSPGTQQYSVSSSNYGSCSVLTRSHPHILRKGQGRHAIIFTE